MNASETVEYLCLLVGCWLFLALKYKNQSGPSLKYMSQDKKKKTHRETVTKHVSLAQTDIQGNILTCALCFFKYLH